MKGWIAQYIRSSQFIEKPLLMSIFLLANEMGVC